MKMFYEIVENQVIFDSEGIIRFDAKIRQSLILDKTLIVIIEFIKNKISNENAYGIDLELKKIAWQIKNENIYDCPFTDMIEGKDKLLYLRNWCHYILKVNPKTGEVLGKTYDDAK